MTPIVRFSRDVLGFQLHPGQAEIVEAIYRDGIRTAVLRLGRRSGKGRIAAVVATYEATVNAAVHLSAVPVGERVAIVAVATSQRQARVVHRYIAGFLHRPALASLVVRETNDELELANGVVIVTLPCHAASARGLAIAVVILDEAAWFQGVDGSPLDVGEIWRALVPATAQFPERRVIVASTPRWSTDWFAQLCERAESGEDPETRVWHASTAAMNPSISSGFLEAERIRDPAYFRREYEALFDASVSAVFDADLVRAAVRGGDEIAPRPGIGYVIAADPAFTGDRFAVLVGHREPDGQVIVDRITSWHGSKAAPVAIDPTLDAIATMAGTYNGALVLIDQFSAEPIRQGLHRRGVWVEERPWSNESKVDAVAAVRRTLYAGRLSIPRHRDLIAELVTLEQRPTLSGRPRIAAPGRAHDDYATGLLALVAHLAAETPHPLGVTIEPPGGAAVAYGAARPHSADRPWGFGFAARHRRRSVVGG
jgi:hypothetical protein